MPELEFEGKEAVYAHHLGVAVRTLKPCARRSVGKEAALDGNLIIHGDNLHALKALLPRYEGKIKCIYIDPPYNTGNKDWCYNDNVNSPLMREWLKENGSVDGEDQHRHDKWLCMMWPRLQLLKQLLTEDGVMFVSIDDNEQHHLGMVMNEIFGEKNFVANIVWRKKAGGGQDSEYFANEHDYIFCYRKSEEFKMNFRQTFYSEQNFHKMKNNRKCKFLRLEKWGANALRSDRPTMYYSIKDPDGNDFYPQSPSREDGRWRTRPLNLEEDHIHWEKKKNRWVPYEVIYFDEVNKKQKIIKERTIFYDVATTTDAAYEQQEIFDKKEMSNSKPIDLIIRLITLGCDKQSVVLDSFAGSGTTAQAVLELNKEDGGNRKFILVECEDYAETITAERVRRVIKGVPQAKKDSLREGLGGSFTYCTMSEALTTEGMLTGEKLPDYATLASHILWIATGHSLTSVPKDRGEDGLFHEDEEHLYYLIYEPSLKFLEHKNSALNFTRAQRILKDLNKKKKKRAIVFATQVFLDHKDLAKCRITFSQLPYCIE